VNAVEICEPFPEWAWPQVWHWTQGFRRQVADDFAPQELGVFVRDMMAIRARTWGVYRDGRVGGVLWFEQTSPVAGIAHAIFSRSFWGSKTTVPAMSAAVAAVMDSGVRKISAIVFADNHAARGIYRRLGFRDEGILRAHTMRRGEMVDMAVCGLTREGWNEFIGRIGRAAGRKEQLGQQPDRHEHEHDIEHVHTGPDGVTDATRGHAIEGVERSALDASGFGGTGRDQQGYVGPDRPDEPLPGATGVH
jgi:RimJ/RimL family protein N-acetyltransferase